MVLIVEGRREGGRGGGAYLVEGVEHVALVAHQLAAAILELGGIKGTVQAGEKNGLEA